MWGTNKKDWFAQVNVTEWHKHKNFMWTFFVELSSIIQLLYQKRWWDTDFLSIVSVFISSFFGMCIFSHLFAFLIWRERKSYICCFVMCVCLWARVKQNLLLDIFIFCSRQSSCDFYNTHVLPHTEINVKSQIIVHMHSTNTYTLKYKINSKLYLSNVWANVIDLSSRFKSLYSVTQNNGKGKGKGRGNSNDIRQHQDNIDSCHGFGLLMDKDVASQFGYSNIAIGCFCYAFTPSSSLLFNKSVSHVNNMPYLVYAS